MTTLSASTWNAAYWNRVFEDDFDASINNISQALSRLDSINIASYSASSTRIDGLLTNGGSLAITGRGLDGYTPQITSILINAAPDLYLDVRGSFNDYSGRINYLKMSVADLSVTFSGALSFSGSSISGVASQMIGSLGNKSITLEGSFTYASTGWAGTINKISVTDGVHSFLAEGGSWSYGSVLPLTTHNSLMYALTRGSETVVGTSAPDVMTVSAGNDTISAGGGIDTVRFSENVASAQFTSTANGQVSVITATSGIDTLISVERVEFTDRGYAFDISGNAGVGAKFITVAFGSSQVPKYLGTALRYLDSGWNTGDLANLIISQGILDRLVGSNSNQDFVKYVFQNTLSRQPTSEELAGFEGLLISGAQTKASLLSLATSAVSDVTASVSPDTNILITGIPYELP